MAEPKKYNGLYFQLAIFVLMNVYVHTYEDIPVIDSQKLGNGISLNARRDMRRNERGQKFTADEMKTLLAAMSLKNTLAKIEEARTGALGSIKDATDEAAEDTIKQSQRSSRKGGKGRQNSYQELCPADTVWLKPGDYYFKSKQFLFVDSNDIKVYKYKYCFNFWYIHFVCCHTKQCVTETCPFTRYDRNSECDEEKSTSNIPVICYTFEKNNGVNYEGKWWPLEFRKISLVTDCCCKKQTYYANDDTCPDSKAG